MKIGNIAKLFGVASSKVRFLEAQGLVHPSRTASGYRYYNQTAVERLSFILQAQSFGFRIEELRCYFAEGGGNTFSGDMVIERMTTKLDELRRDIERACATRDRLIEGISVVRAQIQTTDLAGAHQLVARPAAVMLNTRPAERVRSRHAHPHSIARQRKRNATPVW